ncbi:hypothetical protein TUM12370_15540 [Salmonella enterica subsp. enterica serovar Choleraesuis]|nr:hypothetical protein TUM12370_15540 [Salmonella enterica subsp. enterica serovar Choleraesuis]
MKIGNTLFWMLSILFMSPVYGAGSTADTRQCGIHRVGVYPQIIVIDNREYLESGMFDSESGEYIYLDHSGRNGVMLFEKEDKSNSYIYFVAEKNSRLRPAGERVDCYPVG